MSDRLVVVFEVEDVDAEERLIRGYLASAVPRLDAKDEAELVFFSRYGHDPSVDNGEVVLSIIGEYESIRKDERERWDQLVREGLAVDWWTHVPDFRIRDLDERDWLHFRMRAAASQMTLEYFDRFETLPDAINEFDDEPSETHTGVGWWICLHHLINQHGYQANGGEKEIDLVFENLQNRLFGLATSFNIDRAQSKIEELIESLEARKEDVRRYREEHGEHQHKYTKRSELSEE
ncbi:MAG: hypothetical protein ABEH59_02195 [Halobacteriales archaeon]